MLKSIVGFTLAALLAGPVCPADGQEHQHEHPAPEKLGAVTFRTSCDPRLEMKFERAVALLHSFAYSVSRNAFTEVADHDPHCAMALWGEAMTHFHQLWEPQVDSEDELREGADEIRRAAGLGGTSPREHQYIEALQSYYFDWQHLQPAIRAQRYADAMAEVARTNPTDVEAQIFYALALISTASPADKTYTNQKHAAAILEPIWKREPQHPGIAHYLIHAYDSPALAARGLAAARAYSKIAPSAPHALHMPSHIFTRLGLWNDSVTSNLAAGAAARTQGDTSQQLHAMDYLTYAYLQLGRFDDARKVVVALRAMQNVPVSNLTADYAANVMPVRLAVETQNWQGATQLEPLAGTEPKVAAIVYWARAVGHARARMVNSAAADIAALTACRDQLRVAGDTYWARQTDIMLKSAQAWQMQRQGDSANAIASLRAASDAEDALDKLNLTPGPPVPAREQLGELLLIQHRAADALTEFKGVLAAAPGRRGALIGAKEAAREAMRPPAHIHSGGEGVR